MKIRRSWRIVCVVPALLGMLACNRDKKADQLAALESAYHSGVFTKQEYEAKRAAILGTPPAPAPATPPVEQAAPVPPAPKPDPFHPPEPQPRAARTSPPKATAPTPPTPTPPSPPSIPANPPPEEIKEPAPAPLAGCEDTEIRPGKEKGRQQRFYAATMAQVKAAAITALNSLEFEVHKNDSNEIEASKKRHMGVLMGSGGERMLLHFTPAQEGGRRGTLVTGETKKGFIMRAGQKSWTNAILAQTACALRKGRD